MATSLSPISLPGVAGRDEPDPADPGQLAEIRADMRTARPGGAAGELATLGAGDLGDQHAAHAAAAPDDPHPDIGHSCLRIRWPLRSTHRPARIQATPPP